MGEIGDPRGDSIPFLINALVSYGTMATITEPAEYGLLYTITVYATPGLNFNDPELDFNGPNRRNSGRCPSTSGHGGNVRST